MVLYIMERTEYHTETAVGHLAHVAVVDIVCYVHHRSNHMQMSLARGRASEPRNLCAAR